VENVKPTVDQLKRRTSKLSYLFAPDERGFTLKLNLVFLQLKDKERQVIKDKFKVSPSNFKESRET